MTLLAQLLVGVSYALLISLLVMAYTHVCEKELKDIRRKTRRYRR